MKRGVSILIGILLLSTSSFGHGNEERVLGTVTRIADNTITVETKAKTTITVSIVPETKFVKSGSPAKISDLKVGDKVVIHARKIDSKLQAELVRFGPSKHRSGSYVF